jgi:hypothetical protein
VSATDAMNLAGVGNGYGNYDYCSHDWRIEEDYLRDARITAANDCGRQGSCRFRSRQRLSHVSVTAAWQPWLPQVAATAASHGDYDSGGWSLGNPRVTRQRPRLDLSATKGQPGVPILRAGLVESNLTPARQHARIFGAIVRTLPLRRFACELSTVD